MQSECNGVTIEGGRGTVADAQRGNWVDAHAPRWLRPYARLARWDRPIGFWLLFWPCAFSLALAAMAAPERGFNFVYLVLMFIGAVVMRGAGCTFNDIVDRKIDALVERTRSRPLPSGQVTTKQAVGFLIAQGLVGLVVLLQFNWPTIALGAASLLLVAIYPFMKRVTWWPQLFLGLAFSWGALVGWAAVFGTLGWPALVLYVGCIVWTIGYDTIYALQDIEDDAMIGVKSTARLFGNRARLLIGVFYAVTVLLWIAAAWLAGGGVLFLLGVMVPTAVLLWQAATLDAALPGNALRRFKANHWVGVALTLALVLKFWR
ncbi:MAG: 4-hydroxybenzoate polyprenyltransferase [Devosia sp.]|nr:4-hydroxybenzoate polyprenyltransferase [Devosia sp.]